MPHSFLLRKGFSIAFAALFFSLAFFPIFAEEMSERVALALSSVFEKREEAKMNAALASALAGLATAREKGELLSAFADYEERSGLFESAASRYLQAAEIGERQGAEYFSLCLDAARCYMYMNEAEKANALIQRTLLSCFDSSVLFRARFYSACVRLSGKDLDGALEQIRLYLSIEGFAPYFPQMLFILWRVAGDTEAGSRLISSYPSSDEAAIARGEASVLPRAFWYFMPSVRKPNAAQAEAGEPLALAAGSAASEGASQVSGGIWQQTGFFRSRANAEAQAQELIKAGFRVFIREERRSSGNVFFSVLIPEDEAGNTAIRLRESGFESYLVTE